MKVKDILKYKGPEVFTIGDEKKLYDAMKIMVNNNIGILLVLNSEARIAGIISERDVVRISFNNPDGFKDLPVNSVMTKNIIIVEPEDDIEYVESIMTANRVRHLPVVQNKVLVGLISIGDIVKAMHSNIIAENKYLLDYLSGAVK